MKTVILLRHADIDPPQGPAPDSYPLNATGLARAQTLVHVVGLAGIAAIYTSGALRTQQTAAPIADQLGLQPRLVPPTAVQLVEQVMGDPSAVTLIVGHSNTVPAFITAFGVPFSGPPLSGHDDLFVLTRVSANSASVVRLKYGKAAS